MSLNPSSAELIRAAQDIVAERFKPDRHEIGAALRAESGRIYTAVHVEATVGRITVCAEAIAIGMAVANGESTFSEIVAVDPNGEVVSPCGMCRELISDYSPEALVIVPAGDGPTVVPVSELLPNKYRRGR